MIRALKKLLNCLIGHKSNGNANNRLISKDQLPFNTVAGFVNHSTHDYIGARVLLLQGVPGPGTVLAVTALEKIMKSYLLELGYDVRRDGKGHNLELLMTQIDSDNNQFLNKSERKFIRHVNKSYKLRYPTEIKNNFETFLPAKKVLVNLDALYCKFIESSVLDPVSKDGKWYDMFKIGAMDKSKLVTNNVHFGCDRVQFIESCQTYVAYFPKGQGTLSKFRSTDIVKDDSDWSIPQSIRN